MTGDTKKLVLKIRAVIERYKDELARRMSAILSTYGENVNITPNSKTFQFLLAVLLTFLIYGSDNITLGHIAWAYWALFKTSSDNLLTLEEVMSIDHLKQDILHKNGATYNEVRYTYYNARRRYGIIDRILIPTSSKDGTKKIFKINTSIVLKLVEVLEHFLNKYKKEYGDVVEVLNSVEETVEEETVREPHRAEIPSVLNNLLPYLFITPHEFEEFSINDASIILYLRNDAKVFEENPELPPVDELKISKFADELLQNPLYTTVKLMQISYSLAAKHAFKELDTDDADEVLQNIASKPFFIITDEEYLDKFNPSKHYKLLGFYKSPAPGAIELVKDTIVVNYEPVSFDLFQVYICEEGHVIIEEVDSKTKVTLCPICQKNIVSKAKLTFSGVKADLMSSVEGSVEHPKEFTVLIPKPMWDLLTQYNSTSLLLVKVRDVGKGKSPDKKPVYYPLILFLPRYEHRLSSDEKLIIEYLSRLPTWKILAYLRLAAYGSIRGMDHTIIAMLLTAFSQGKQYLQIEKLMEMGDLFDNVVVHIDRHVIAAPLNTIVVGKSATAKTSIALKTLDLAAPDVSKGLCYMTIPGSSRAGIFMGIDKQSKSRIKLGIEPINDGRLVVYDEVDKLAKMNNKDEIVSMFLQAIYHGKISLTQIKKSERPTRVARIFLMNSEMLQRDTFVEIQDLVDAIITGIQTSRSTVKIFGEQSEQFLSRIDMIVYHPEYYGSMDFVQKVVLPAYTKYKEEIADVTNTIAQGIGASNIRDLKNKVYSAIQKYFIYVREGISYDPIFEIPSNIVKLLKEELESLKKYVTTHHGSIDAVPALKYIFKFDSDRRVESLLRLARAIARMHLRNTILLEDLKEAIAFYLFIHSYPFILYYDEKRKKATLDVLSRYKPYLGVFYDLLEGALLTLPSPQELVVEETVEPRNTQKKEIRNKEELIKFLLEIVKQLHDKGLRTTDGVPLADVAHELYNYIKSNSLIVNCTAKECKELKNIINLSRTLSDSDVLALLQSYLFSIFDILSKQGLCILNTYGKNIYVDLVL